MIRMDQGGHEARSSLKGRSAAGSGYQAVEQGEEFEDRFFDPDHPKDSDWVSDIDYERLFADRRAIFLKVQAGVDR